ncbi:hypothetical protein CORC01_04950 [Colletotrichum orchidophilum]|uniref:LPXTG-domain-containing protein n=1 Tax=Colletotrichum orchidophilum TaxID=1209926 RepID=A0A1G4BEE9_9PEZI|nr:uncharacterized protein CORC01_04950 [Colletotrichum orchidophilum]OHE99814.1 hypothetical protein CORC01_04950 [Colletotrichum orchidophilum]
MTTAYPAETNQNGTVTSFIALPTVFTPPTSCSTIYRLNGFTLAAYDPGYGIDIDTRVRCAPPAVTTWWEQRRLGLNDGEGHTAVSIGPLVCPDRWPTVAISVKNDTRSTLAMCCPADYTLIKGIPGTITGECRSDLLSGAVITYASTSAPNSLSWTMVTSTLTEPGYVGAIAVLGWTFQETTTKAPTTSTAKFGDNDATATPTEAVNIYTPTLPRETTHSDPSSTTTQPTLGATSEPEPAGLPLPTTIGIGVGAAVGGIALTALVFFLCRRKRSQRYKSKEIAPVTKELHAKPLEPDKFASPTRYHELYVHQQDRNREAAELPVPQYFAELDGGGRR